MRHVEDRPGHDRRYALDSGKLARRVGWKVEVPFEQGIRETVDWFRSNEAWWRPIKAGEFRTYYERMYSQRKVLEGGSDVSKRRAVAVWFVFMTLGPIRAVGAQMPTSTMPDMGPWARRG